MKPFIEEEQEEDEWKNGERLQPHQLYQFNTGQHPSVGRLVE